MALYIGYRLGGVVVMYGKDKNDNWKFLFEDSGYLIRSADQKTIWVSRMPDAGSLRESNGNIFLVRSHFYRSLHDELKPINLILLRLLNLTILRYQWIGDFFRKIVVQRLMSSRIKGSIVLLREITVMSDKIRITDNISTGQKIDKFSRVHSLFRCRRITGTHMASARYFQAQEMEKTELDWIEKIPWPKNGETLHETVVNINGSKDDR
jgi:hypothetical protein